LGFKIDKSLYGEDCFPNYNNLPMIATDIDSDRIIDILNNVPSAAYDKEAVCLIGDRDIQLYAGIGLNLLTFMNLVPETERKEYIIKDYGLNYGPNDTRNVNYKYLYNLIKKEPGEFETLIIDIENGRRMDSNQFPGYSNLHKRIFTKEEAETSAVTSQVEEPLDRKSRASRAAITPALAVVAEMPSRSNRRTKTTTHTQTQRQSKTKSQSKVSRQDYPVKRARRGNPLSVIEEEQEEKSRTPSVFLPLKSMLFTEKSRKSTARGLKKRKHSKVTRRKRRKY
jgi:hypothetical protein